jgi:hypothetical protein
MMRNQGNMISSYSIGYNGSWEYIRGETIIIPREGKTKNLSDLIQVMGTPDPKKIVVFLSTTLTHFIVEI